MYMYSNIHISKLRAKNMLVTPRPYEEARGPGTHYLCTYWGNP